MSVIWKAHEGGVREDDSGEIQSVSLDPSSSVPIELTEFNRAWKVLKWTALILAGAAVVRLGWMLGNWIDTWR